MPPWPLPAVVVSQDPDRYSLNVAVGGIGGGQMPSLPVKVLTHGPRDAVRGHYPELPLPGTHGLVVFPRGDPRNGHWMGATDPALNDSSTMSPGNGNQAWHAHYGGGASWRGPDGSLWEEWPDGSTLLVGPTTPSPTRHTIDDKGVRQRSPFPLARRVAVTVANPFGVAFSQSSGAQLTIDQFGNWTVTAPADATITLTNGSATLALDADGSVHVTVAGGKTMTVDAGGATKAVRLSDGSASTTLFAE